MVVFYTVGSNPYLGKIESYQVRQYTKEYILYTDLTEYITQTVIPIPLQQQLDPSIPARSSPKLPLSAFDGIQRNHRREPGGSSPPCRTGFPFYIFASAQQCVSKHRNVSVPGEHGPQGNRDLLQVNVGGALGFATQCYLPMALIARKLSNALTP